MTPFYLQQEFWIVVCAALVAGILMYGLWPRGDE